MSVQKATIDKYLRTTGFVVITACAAWIAWQLGQSKHTQNTTPNSHEKQRPSVFRVDGPSMVPTLFGPSQRCQCQICQHSHLVSPDIDTTLQRHRICSLCGGTLRIVEKVDGQLVGLQPSSGEFHVGDVVAITVGQQIRAKRLVGLPGDTISVRQGSLLVNYVRIDDVIARQSVPAKLAVNIDSDQAVSRWKTLPNGKNAEAWHVYQHINPYDQQSSPVQDDYQYNVGLTRQLNDADRLQVSFHVQTSSDTIVQVAFWTTDGVVSTIKNVSDSQSLTCSYYDCQATTDDLPVAAEHPVAIKVKSPATISKRSVHRFVHYRLRKSDRTECYPLTLEADECFLLGDNVPISVDGRELGPSKMSDLLGQVRLQKQAPEIAD